MEGDYGKIGFFQTNLELPKSIAWIEVCTLASTEDYRRIREDLAGF
jgi:hypothetical protein